MTNRLLHTDAKGTTLEITDTTGIHTLVTTHEQGAATVILSVDIPAHMANALLADPPARPLSDNDLGTALAQVLILDGRTHSADAYQIAEKLVPVVQNLLRANTPAVHQGIPSTFAPTNHKFDWEKTEANSKLLREAEAKTEGAATNPDWQPTPGDGARRVGLSRFRTRPVPGPVMYGSPWDSAFGDEALSAAAARAAAEDELIDAHVVEDDGTNPWAGGRGKPENPGKGKGKKPKKEKPAKPEKEDKPGKGNAFGRRMAVLRYIVDHLDGDLPFPKGPKGPAWDFYTRSLEAVEAFILETGVEAFAYDPRGLTPDVGYGTPLDGLTTAALLELAAALPVTSFHGEGEDRKYLSLDEVLTAVLHDVYENLWSVVGDGLSQGELTVNEKDQIALAETGPADEPDEDEDELPVE